MSAVRKMFSRRVFLCVLTMVPVCKPAIAQHGGCTTQEIVVNALSENGHLLTGLGPSSFRALAHGQRLPIVSSGMHIHPARVVILLDTSGSMREPQDKLAVAEAATVDAVQSINPAVQVALLTFADGVNTVAPITSTRESVEASVRAMYRAGKNSSIAQGKTSLRDAILAAVKILDPPQIGDAIYLITDGGENGSRSSARELRNQILGKRIRLFAFLLVSAVPRTPEEQSGPADFVELLQATGGSGVVYGPTASGRDFITAVSGHTVTKDPLFLATHQMYREFNTFYTVTLQASFSNPTKWKLELLDDGGAVRKNVRLHYPHELTSCPTASQR